MAKITDYARGSGREIFPGYRIGDSWIQTVGKHTQCEGRVEVIGPGWGRDAKGHVGDGVLVRCLGCMYSWVIR